jgi:Zn finger protein HypA/HybF involved in hydrogenase expression
MFMLWITSCRSRAVLCINKHWVHFNCEKFTKLEIEQIEQNENEPYTCSQCKTKEVKVCVDTSLCVSQFVVVPLSYLVYI